MQNHFDQAELIIQAESGDFAFVIPACAAARPTINSIVRTMTNPDHFIVRHHLDTATCVPTNMEIFIVGTYFLEKATL